MKARLGSGAVHSPEGQTSWGKRARECVNSNNNNNNNSSSSSNNNDDDDLMIVMITIVIIIIIIIITMMMMMMMMITMEHKHVRIRFSCGFFPPCAR